ncbi:hypothetical protein H4Q32_021366 [Labeo rohita]|uniref:Uncharacterized protein n=1 Tax=Labeo rohita TaxID=84645 RepID=A0ABQ8MQP1_LABRO|nr:hypothetical protein H4Q32_021366 [Labeo rohita]
MELKELQDKCNMEGRMWRRNIRIVGVAEELGSASVESVSKLLSEVLNMDKIVLRSCVEHEVRLLNGDTIAIFLHYTASVAKARAAFTDFRKLLREQ